MLWYLTELQSPGAQWHFVLIVILINLLTFKMLESIICRCSVALFCFCLAILEFFCHISTFWLRRNDRTWNFCCKFGPLPPCGSRTVLATRSHRAVRSGSKEKQTKKNLGILPVVRLLATRSGRTAIVRSDPVLRKNKKKTWVFYLLFGEAFESRPPPLIPSPVLSCQFHRIPIWCMHVCEFRLARAGKGSLSQQL